MGILKEPAAFVKALKLPAGFSVCEFGDQLLSFTDPPSPARGFYEALGCARYEAIDGNGRGTVTADLNLPVTKLGMFDLVTDFGTGEHIFDQAQVWRTLHDLTKPGGFIVFDRPTEGYDVHCFYTIHQTLIRDLAAANAYRLVRLDAKQTPRGALLRGVLQRPTPGGPFQIPQQGRYRSSLRLPRGGL